VFSDDNLTIVILIFAVLELWLIQVWIDCVHMLEALCPLCPFENPLLL